MNLKLGYFIPPLVLLAFVACIFMFGGTMYKNYEIDKVIKADRKMICLTQSYDVKQDPTDQRFFVTFADGKKFYFPNFKPTKSAEYILLVVDKQNRIMWTTVTKNKMEYINSVYSVPFPGCRA